MARHGGARRDWLDLSTGINPTSWPVPALPQGLWHRLPEAADEAAAIDAARAAYGAPAAAGIVVAPGTQALLQVLPRLFPPQTVAVIGPTYEEHARCWAAGGHDVVAADGIATAEASARIAVVVNPNNPDGRVREPARLDALARRLAARGGLLVVDEAFADCTPEWSLANRTGAPGLVVLRSLGKFYGLAGARVGFALTYRALAERLRDALGPWAVGAPALAVAAGALRDRTWTVRQRRVLAERRVALERVLEERGFALLGGTDLFVLAAHRDAARTNRRLLFERVLVRAFPAEPDRLRFGIPGGQRALRRLSEALDAR